MIPQLRSPDPTDLADVLAVTAARAADKKFGEDIAVLDVGPILGLCDWFVIVSGNSAPQIKAILDQVEEDVASTTGERPRRSEGLDTRRWVILDYGDVVVHIFHAEDREFYRLERLFTDAERMNWSDGSAPVSTKMDTFVAEEE